VKSQKKRRLDVVVAERTEISRERAQALIMAGRVLVEGEPVTKSGSSVGTTARIEVRDDARFVSRGALKLEKALDEFGWPVTGLRCLDVGASTGGFTDCLLKRGAASVTALDVGYGQIAWKLRADPRVTVIERCNFRHVAPDQIGAPFAFACADVSFISLTKLAVKFFEVLAAGGHLVVLVKPQFEAGRSAVGKGGVVRDPALQIEAIQSVAAALSAAGITPERLTYSPILGPAGNIEFLLGGVRRADEHAVSMELDTAGVVAAGHEALVR
jgi:23S rRNA (cytidine1920-2'-O)/16S rRNA (cytidine1409-2'-O)-methyltransferase